jgi:hypothetical protein
MTWFKPGMGNCGKHNTVHDMIVAIPTSAYGHGQHCDKHIKIWTKSGKSVTALIRDRCPDCGHGDLGEYKASTQDIVGSHRLFFIDVSPAVFEKFAKLGKGVEKISWEVRFL